MRAPVLLAALSIVVGACAARPASYVVRLDLDRIAAQTAARDASPGFTSLKRAG